MPTISCLQFCDSIHSGCVGEAGVPAQVVLRVLCGIFDHSPRVIGNPLKLDLTTNIWINDDNHVKNAHQFKIESPIGCPSVLVTWIISNNFTTLRLNTQFMLLSTLALTQWTPSLRETEIYLSWCHTPSQLSEVQLYFDIDAKAL